MTSRTCGVDYEIGSLYVISGSLALIVNKTIPDSLKSALTLNVGSSQFLPCKRYF